MGNYKPTMRHYTTMDSDKYYELLWQNSGFADAAVLSIPHFPFRFLLVLS